MQNECAKVAVRIRPLNADEIPNDDSTKSIKAVNGTNQVKYTTYYIFNSDFTKFILS